MGRRVVLASAASAFAAAVVFACSSDDLLSDLELDAGYTFLDSSVQKDSAATTDDAATDDTTTDGGSPLPDAGADPTSGCQTCDCDHDGYDRPGCGDDTGTDCDDLDSNVHPDAGFSTASPGKDIDCTHAVEKQYATGVSCGALGLNCSKEGFSGDAGCGESASYVVCTGVVVCTGTTSTRVQGCR